MSPMWAEKVLVENGCMFLLPYWFETYFSMFTLLVLPLFLSLLLFLLFTLLCSLSLTFLWSFFVPALSVCSWSFWWSLLPTSLNWWWARLRLSTCTAAALPSRPMPRSCPLLSGYSHTSRYYFHYHWVTLMLACQGHTQCWQNCITYPPNLSCFLSHSFFILHDATEIFVRINTAKFTSLRKCYWKMGECVKGVCLTAFPHTHS